MYSAASIVELLQTKSKESTRKTYARHGTPIEKSIGVSVADIKAVAKLIKGQQELAYELYDTGLMESMYLAGIVADGSKMSTDRLDRWADFARDMTMISEYTVPWVAVENPKARELALSWIRSDEDHISSAGWSTYSGLLATKPDDHLDLNEIKELVDGVVTDILGAKNRTRYSMNSFVIEVGAYVIPLHDAA